jgi:Ca-activated chloride channel family protein
MKNTSFKIFNEGFVFSKFTPKEVSHFERVFGIFKELITHTAGDLDEAFDWMETLDKEYNIFNEAYTLENFKEDLIKRGYIKQEVDPKEGTEGTGKGKSSLTAKMESALRQYALDQIFGKLKKSGAGDHKTKKLGSGKP